MIDHGDGARAAARVIVENVGAVVIMIPPRTHTQHAGKGSEQKEGPSGVNRGRGVGDRETCVCGTRGVEAAEDAGVHRDI